MPVCLSMSAHQRIISVDEMDRVCKDQRNIDMERAWNNCQEGMVWDGQGLT